MELKQTELSEIISRAENGVTRPFYCRCEDGFPYYVKGRDAGFESLCNETVAGLIASDWGLPIPEFKLIDVPENLIQYSTRSDRNDLGVGLAWGIQEVPNTINYSVQCRKEIPDDLSMKILLFDWFVRNEDRSQTNPNLLWNALKKELAVIDHNIAFDCSFRAGEFWSSHVFRDEKEKIFDQSVRERYENLLKECIVKIDSYFSVLPEEWKAGFAFDAYREHVEICLRAPWEHPGIFWSGENGIRL